MYKPAVEGTINMLHACARVASVKKFIMTSSIFGMFICDLFVMCIRMLIVLV